ncbi:MAG: electron transfer flavoprotein-quinone oxidoreductase [Chloroflexota bacterium]|nr:electron transfer flavoprotein-quinone oxidoreductase [Chloroflexota bacterium]
MIERGDEPGTKNVMGGVLYRQPTEKIIPGWWRDAPVERPVVEERVWMITEDSMLQGGFKSNRYAEEPYNAFTVLRVKFDKWFADKATAAGALLITNTVVEDVLRDENGRIVGVRTGREEGEVRADVVIAADGVNSLLSKKAGLHGELAPENVALVVKEIINMSREKIEDRFLLNQNEGATIEVFGDSTARMLGYGFIYTNRDSLSVGTGALLSDFIKKKLKPNDLLEGFKSHPMLKKLLDGGEAKEYMAHLIPEGGAAAMPPVYTDGMLVVGDAAGMSNAIYREGSNLALVSAKLAAQTCIEAHEVGDFSARTLSRYKTLLDDSFIMKDLRLYSRTSSFFHQKPEFLELYPELLMEAAHTMLSVDSVPKQDKQRQVLRQLLGKRAPWELVRDAVGALRALS